MLMPPSGVAAAGWGQQVMQAGGRDRSLAVFGLQTRAEAAHANVRRESAGSSVSLVSRSRGDERWLRSILPASGAIKAPWWTLRPLMEEIMTQLSSCNPVIQPAAAFDLHDYKLRRLFLLARPGLKRREADLKEPPGSCPPGF